jgi:ABC-type transport system involved in multi-copper enzyme maturation permease subunit
MMAEILRFELRQQLRAPLLWLIAGMFGLFAFGAGSSDAIQIGGSIGNVHRNAPSVIITMLGVYTVLGLFAVVSFVSGALLRDFEQGTADLYFSSPLRQRDFLIGRFTAALIACTVVYAAVVLGLIVAQFMPWVDPERLGPFSLMPYLWGMAVLVLPNVLFTGALLALLAVTTRSLLVVYLGVIAFFVLWAVAGTLTRDLDNLWLATLIDPFGVRALTRMLRYWSVDERNTRLPELAGYVLANRALWGSIGIALAAAAFASFKPQRAGTGKAWFRRKRPLVAPSVSPSARAAVVRVSPAFGHRVVLAQFLRQLRFDTLGVLRSVPFLVMLMFAVFNLTGSASVIQSLFGTEVYPTTSLMLQALKDSYSFMLVFVVAFYAGELVWKERNAGMGDVTDAMPVPNTVPLAGKFLALVAVVLVFQAVGVLTAMTIQLAKSYSALEPGLYLRASLLDAIPFVLMGGLALVLQVLTNNRFVGYGLLIVVVVAQTALGLLHFDHNLYNYAGAPAAPYSDMNGYGHFLRGRLWFQGYWGLFLIALLLLAAAFWVRGVAPSRRERMALARQRLRGGLGFALAASMASFAAVGGIIFWNANVLNRYQAGDVALDEQQRYETAFRQYKDLPQPRIIAMSTEVDLRPETRSAHITGEYTIANRHAEAISELHILIQPEATVNALEFGPADLQRFDEALGYRIFRLHEPLQPGEQRTLRFDLDYSPHGFTNDSGATDLVENGSFINSRMLPSFGYNPNGEIRDRNERRKRAMGEPERMAKLEDEAARANTYLGGDADWIAFKTTVCTAPDQIALAPGYLQREFERDGRRCFAYAMDRPMLAFAAWLSARWEVKKDSYQGIPIEVYYDRKHGYNVERMIDSVKQSLAYFQANFSPYQHRQVRILEFPGYNSFAQSFANTIPFSESIGFVADLRDDDAIDYVFYVTAHEVAHQWWAHQVIGANVQGATLLSESLAQYSALMVMEKAYGRAKMRRFLKYELDRYLSDRGGELVEEQPLYRVENQQYVHYRKGSLVFYRLREEMGEAALNRALAKFIADKAFQQAPFATSAELLTYLRAEAAPEQQGLITDLFEKIAFYDNRVVEASATRRADGSYEVNMRLKTGKRYADGMGKELPAPLDDLIEVGIFARAPGAEEAQESVLLLEKHRFTEAEPSLRFVVAGEPYEVGIDPYNKLIDRVPNDNRRRVVLP